MNPELIETLKCLRLGGLLAHWDDYLKVAADGRFSHAHLLTHVLEEEMRIKRHNALSHQLIAPQEDLPREVLRQPRVLLGHPLLLRHQVPLLLRVRPQRTLPRPARHDPLKHGVAREPPNLIPLITRDLHPGPFRDLRHQLPQFLIIHLEVLHLRHSAHKRGIAQPVHRLDLEVPRHPLFHLIPNRGVERQR